MPFKQWFNWAKFKVIPASILHRNRLYIERDSKHRRVMSNFGLTFRNSKWSDYSTANVSTHTRASFLKSITPFFQFLFSLVLIYFGLQYSITAIELSFLSESLWFFLEFNVSYLTFLSGVLSVMLHNLWVYGWTVFLQYLYGIDNSTKTPWSTDFQDSTTTRLDYYAKAPELSSATKALIAKAYLLEGSSKSSTSVQLAPDFANLFPKNPTTYNQYATFFKTLYKATNTLHLAYQTNHLPFTLNTPATLSTNLFKVNQLDQFFLLTLNLTVPKKAPTTPTLTLKANTFKWNLNTILSEVDHQASSNEALKHWVSGPFYQTQEDFYTWNKRLTRQPALPLISSALEDQIKIIKWNRSLYRYNLLHRKVLESSNKLTNAKRLVTGGFFDSRLMSHNLWASNFFAPRQNAQKILTNQTQSLYGNVFNRNTNPLFEVSSLRTNALNNHLDNLAFYEKSYMFILHRFHMFNQIGSLRISSNFMSKKHHLSETSLNSLSSAATQTSIMADVYTKHLLTSSNEFGFLKTYSVNLRSTHPTLNYNNKPLWKEEFSNTLFSYDNSNLLLSLSDISDWRKNQLPVYSYHPESMPFKTSPFISKPLTLTMRQKKSRKSFFSTL